jgi:ligand-binding sensor domain-containing protein
MKLIFLIPLVLIHLLATKAQESDLQFSFESLKLRESELSSQKTMSIIQDSRGFLWIATQGGLNRYDGYSFRIYKQDARDSLTLGGDYIKSVFEDKNGNIVINTNNTVDIYHPHTDNFSHADSRMDNTISANSTFAVHALQLNDKSIFFVSDNELFDYNSDTEIATQLDILAKTGFESRIYGESIIYTEDDGGKLWIAHEKQLIGYDPSTGKTIYANLAEEQDFSGSRIFSIHSNSINQIGIFTDTDYLVYNYSEEELSTYSCYNIPGNLLNYSSLVNLFQDEKGVVWMTTDDSRIVLFNPETRTFTDYEIMDETGKTHGRLRTLIQDRQNIWWLATPNKGIYYSYPQNQNSFKHILEQADPGTGLSNGAASAILRTMDRKLWIGTDGGGINVYDPFTGSFTYYTHSLEDTNTIGSNSVLTLFQDSYGRILLGGYQGGLSYYNFAQKNFRTFLPDENKANRISHHDVRGIVEIEDGQYLVAQNGGKGLQLFDIYAHKFTDFGFNPGIEGGDIVSHWLTQIYRDTKEDIWLGGYGGLGKFDPKSGLSRNYLSVEGDTTSLSNSWVYAIYRDSDGILWIGTSYGLNRFHDKTETFTSYTERDGLPDNIINAIAEDDENNLWIATNKGISRLNRKTMEFSNYDASDGLKVEQFIHGSYYKDDDGIIYFGGNGGVVIIDPKNFKKNEFIPPVFLTDFQLSYKSVDIGKKGSPLQQHISYTDEIVLNHKQNMITFNYVAINYMSSRKNQYEYRMEGFDDDWKKVGSRREATYTNLNPGKYVFRVRATNNDGVLNEEGTSVAIIITPPWWKRWWFRVLVIGTIAYLVYSIIRAREQASKRDKEILRLKIEEGEHEVQTQKDEIEAQKQALLDKEASEKESKWFNENMAHLGGVISRNTSDLYKMAGELTGEITKALGASLGAIYVLFEDEREETCFELIGNYGLDQARVKNKFEAREGYLGAIYMDRKTIIIDNLPTNYAVLKSGLGSVSMKYLLMVPLMHDKNLKGVVELASLEKFEKNKINLIERLADNIAAAIEILTGNERMKALFEELNSHTEELNAQKEEMQQNLEEMSATHEEIDRIRQEEKQKEQDLLKQNELLKKKENELHNLEKKYAELEKELEKYRK